MYHSGCILIKSGSTTHLRHVYVRVSDNDDDEDGDEDGVCDDER